MTRRLAILLALLTLLLSGLAGWTYDGLRNARTRAAKARDDLVVCRRLAEEIERFRAGPTLATDGEEVASEVTGLVERAAKAAKLRQSGLVRIMPGPAQRVGDTVYKEEPTTAILERVRLGRTVALMHHLVSGRPPLDVRSIRLTATRPQQSTDAWDGEIVVTYLVYEPPKTNK